MIKKEKTLFISIEYQEIKGFENNLEVFNYPVSTAANGPGEVKGSECTPRGWHKVYSVIGAEHEINSVFVGRKWTGEIYSEQLAAQFPGRDWILTRIIQLDGLEPGRNKGENVDTLERFIYIHGTPDSTQLGIPGSHGCIRLSNTAVILLAEWVTTDTLVYIQ
ncbi:L,D-transpeptidase [Legionella worsleiensis]|uniref:Putative ErfK/YbiS/YcfS/YnhG protein n=1 Tax=Legionella worsleiensis TaxID=45076 RepID=A0A0W1A7C2_9GAMM|nr:L,D-transpeptidase [Legionella worsleiensis]KTD76947.1 putative ErfK/YbiS/YcfS/YnhG protein [Legionella worsleiensis]STY33382.1 putative ErfK/YbiS/YcfS/YnhG protein [Legionella worsleiensis]